MRIAIVGTELCAVGPAGGGLEQVLIRWASYLAARHEVVIVSLPKPGELAGRLAAIKPDIVSLHNRPAWARFCGRAEVAVTFHNYPTAWKTRAPLPGRARYSAVSSALASIVTGPCTVTPPSIAPEFFSAVAAPRGRTVLFPNRLMAKKGVRELLAVAPRLPDVRFEFADLISPWLRPTAEHRALRSLVGLTANASLFPPTTSARQLAPLYASAGVVVCPAVEPEGLGLVPLEAQACRAPVVTTDMGGLREATFPPNQCIAPHDTDALAAALMLALDRRDTPVDVAARYSPESSGASYERWLTEGV